MIRHTLDLELEVRARQQDFLREAAAQRLVVQASRIRVGSKTKATHQGTVGLLRRALRLAASLTP